MWTLTYFRSSYTYTLQDNEMCCGASLGSRRQCFWFMSCCAANTWRSETRWENTHVFKIGTLQSSTHSLALIFGSYNTNLSVLRCPHNTNCVMTSYSVVGNLVSLFTALRHPLLLLGTIFIHHSRLCCFLIFFSRGMLTATFSAWLTSLTKMKAACLAETLPSVYQNTQSHDLDDHDLNSHSHKNLKYNTIT
jgi:hypothetical protein